MTSVQRQWTWNAVWLAPLLLCGCAVVERLTGNGAEDARKAELKQQIQTELEQRHPVAQVDEVDTPRRPLLQEWLDHQASAWLPVAVLSDAITRWPRGATVDSIDVTQSALTIRATSVESASLLVSGMNASVWMGPVSKQDLVVSASLIAVERERAPGTVEGVESMVKELADGHVLGNSPSLSDRNLASYRSGTNRLFNCGAEGSASAPSVQTGEWVGTDWMESGMSWSRRGATIEVKGDFVSVVKGLDCARNSGWRLAVQSLNFKPDAESAGNVVLTMAVALIGERTAMSPQPAPWGDETAWGGAPPPERKKVLNEIELIDPFKP